MEKVKECQLRKSEKSLNIKVPKRNMTMSILRSDANNFALLLLLVVTITTSVVKGQPQDERCDNATPIQIDGPKLTSSTFDQTIDGSLSFLTCNDDTILDAASNGVCFSLKGTGAKLHATTCFEDTSSDFEYRLSVFAAGDTGCDGRICLKSGDEPHPNCPFGNAVYVEWETLPGIEYLLFVHDTNIWSGNFAISVEDVSNPSENDSCDQAIVLEEKTSTDGSTVGAAPLDINDDAQCNVPQYPGVWYLIPSQNITTPITMITCSSFFRMDVSIFASDTGDACVEGNQGSTLECVSNLTSVSYDETCGKDSDGYGSQLEFTADADTDYYLFVHQYDDGDNMDSTATSTTGTFQIIYNRQQTGGNPTLESGNPSSSAPASAFGVCSFASVLFFALATVG